MGSAALAAIGVHTITAATPLSVKNLFMPMKSPPPNEKWLTGKKQRFVSFRGRLCSLPLWIPLIQKPCCASATLFRMIRGLRCYTVTVLSLDCHDRR